MASNENQMTDGLVDTMPDQLEALASQLLGLAKEFREKHTPGSRDLLYRSKIIGTARAVIGAATLPDEQVMDPSISIGSIAATRMLIEWNAFEHIPDEGTISYAELAAKCNVQESLLTRMAWMLVATGVLVQSGTDQVGHTPKSKIYASSNPTRALFLVLFDLMLQGLSHLPDFFRQNGAKEPVAETPVPIGLALGMPDKSFWEILNTDPKIVQNFTLAMSITTQFQPITGMFDFSHVLEAAKDKERPVFVDVGGGKGHCIKAILGEFSNLPIDRCVLQDRPETIDLVNKMDDEALKGLQTMAIDFHKEQPVKGALVYWLRRCLHDYGDEVCTNMLKVLSKAMAPDSRLLIVETIQENPPSAMAMYLDMAMLNLGGKERTIKGFEKIVGAASLKIVGIHRSKTSAFGVIECMKAST